MHTKDGHTDSSAFLSVAWLFYSRKALCVGENGLVVKQHSGCWCSTTAGFTVSALILNTTTLRQLRQKENGYTV